ncbi:hypothetical protein OPKNFCMD_3553 [Methylobacterium crusticola]|uniref:FAD-binding domain-containing protein n=1 Tax=Methylobacterium crusticola TaxID=1697972 RepID=A0ABQ4R048_9HYPH|nr:hypothetical protein [Methylobacterium crusticola]GJD50807.1 hypothetical protein OPKNFCMD_3553 [Methylobacterium crusticola]
MREGRFIGRIGRFVLPQSTWSHYEEVGAFPRGLLVVGDALCRLNPIYGQGMTLAAQQACILRDLPAGRGGAGDPLADLGQDLFRAIQPTVGGAWGISAVPDFAHPRTSGTRPPDLETDLRFGAGIQRLAARDPDVHRLLLGVRQLLLPPSVLREPTLLRAVEMETGRAGPAAGRTTRQDG